MDMDKIRVLSRPTRVEPAQPPEEEQQPSTPPPVAPQVPDGQDDTELDQEEETEEGLRRSNRNRKQTLFFTADTQEVSQEVEQTGGQERKRMSPRERKRRQARAAKTSTPRCIEPGHGERNCVGSRDHPGMVRTPLGKRKERWRTAEEEGQEPGRGGE